MNDICEKCPLASCDESSVYCVWRLFTNPNAAQIKRMRPAKERKVTDRSEYYANYYRQNRERKLAAANARNASVRKSL